MGWGRSAPFAAVWAVISKMPPRRPAHRLRLVNRSRTQPFGKTRSPPGRLLQEPHVPNSETPAVALDHVAMDLNHLVETDEDRRHRLLCQIGRASCRERV